MQPEDFDSNGLHQVQGLLNVKNTDNFTLPVNAFNFNYSSQVEWSASIACLLVLLWV